MILFYIRKIPYSKKAMLCTCYSNRQTIGITLVIEQLVWFGMRECWWLTREYYVFFLNVGVPVGEFSLPSCCGNHTGCKISPMWMEIAQTWQRSLPFRTLFYIKKKKKHDLLLPMPAWFWSLSVLVTTQEVKSNKKLTEAITFPYFGLKGGKTWSVSGPCRQFVKVCFRSL